MQCFDCIIWECANVNIVLNRTYVDLMIMLSKMTFLHFTSFHSLHPFPFLTRHFSTNTSTSHFIRIPTSIFYNNNQSWINKETTISSVVSPSSVLDCVQWYQLCWLVFGPVLIKRTICTKHRGSITFSRGILFWWSPGSTSPKLSPFYLGVGQF